MRFSQKEIDDLIEDYQQNHLSLHELCDKYNRTSGSIINKLKSLNIYQDTRLNISKEDMKRIIQYYQSGDLDNIFKLYPSLSKQSLYSRMSNLGVKSGSKNYWTEEELELVKNHYYDTDIDELIMLLNNRHTKDSIQSKALKYFDYGIKNYWTDNEDNIIKEKYSVIPLDNLLAFLPNRTRQAIIERARHLKVISYQTLETYWSDQQTKYLIDNWKTKTDYEIGEQLHKEKRSVMEKRHALGLYLINRDELSYSDLNKYLRGNTSDWKNKSIELCNGRCLLTDSTVFEVHHIYNVADIIDSIFSENNIQIKAFNNYTKEELDNILSLFKTKLYSLPFGVCLRPDIHALYHSIYGKHNNNELQWNAFLNDYRNNKYIT